MKVDIVKKVQARVQQKLGHDKNGHNFDHVLRVLHVAEQIQKVEGGNLQVVRLTVLLHDVDDYKIVGSLNAEKMTNAKKIMKEAGIKTEIEAQVLENIRTMGYSKYLQGIRPTSLEGKIVSDADMIDAVGANGLIRSLEYNFSKYPSKPFFNPKYFPLLNQSAERYKNTIDHSVIDHFFVKILKLKNIMMTKEGRKIIESRHNFIVNFLKNYFAENNQLKWQKYLDQYLIKELKKEEKYLASFEIKDKNGEKIFLRQLDFGDIESISKNANNKMLAQNLYIHFPFPYSKLDAENFIKQVLEKRSYVWGIEIGKKVVGVFHLTVKDNIASFGYWLGEKYWGRGIMTEACKIITDYAFDSMGVNRIEATIFKWSDDEWNFASEKVVLKNGFEREGLKKQYCIRLGRACDLLLYGKVRADGIKE